MANLNWTTKTDNVDDVLAEDFNNLVSSIETELEKKVDKITGKGLSTNDYTDTDKAKLDTINIVDNLTSTSTTSALSANQGRVLKESLQYYGYPDIIPSDESYFTVNETGETITGLTDEGKTQTTLIIPYKINGVKITTLYSGIGGTSILEGATDKIIKVILPNSITNIGTFAFWYCTSLTSINIPDSVTSIEVAAFINCTSLTSINIPNSVTSIGSSVFEECSSLKTINIPNSVTSIAADAFVNCANLTIYCEQGSYAETYAKTNNIPVMYTDISATEFDNKADKSTISDLKQKSIPHTTASGYPLTVTDRLDGEAVINYQVYGNSVQDGTPSPENPVEIQSVGDLVTDETSEYYGKYAVPVKVCGKNLISYPYTQSTQTKYGIDFTDNGDQTITANGTATASATLRLMNWTTFDKTKQYYITGCPTGGMRSKYSIYVSYWLNGNWVYEQDENGDGLLLNLPNMTKEFNQIQINCSVWNGATVENLTFKPMLVEGSTATSYEPYIPPVTKHIYLDEPLRKVGDYADYVDFENQKVVRQIKELILDGTETWYKGIAMTNTLAFYIKPNDISSGANQYSMLCNKFVVKSSGVSSIDEEFLQHSGLSVYIKINKSRLDGETIDNFKIWVSNNNLEIYYILATPIEEPVIVPELTSPNSAAMNVSSETATQPSQIDLTYYQDINKKLAELQEAITALGGI